MIDIFAASITTSDWAQILSATGTLIAAIVAVVAALQSYRSAKQSNETNEQLTRPRVVVYADNSKYEISYIDLVIFNEGGGLARNIEFTVSGDDPPVSFSDGKNKHLSDLDVITKGIKVLPAKSSRSYFVLSTLGQVEEIMALNSHIGITYTNSSGTKKYNDTFSLDFTSLPKMRFTEKEVSQQKKLTQEVEKIRRVLEKKK